MRLAKKLDCKGLMALTTEEPINIWCHSTILLSTQLGTKDLLPGHFKTTTTIMRHDSECSNTL
jgi:hypothetical protein